MSKVTVALGSFIVGACCMFIALSGNHASIFAQGRIVGQGIPNVLSIPDAVPEVSSKLLRVSGITIEGTEQQIDGLDCEGCTFNSPVLTYGGGPFRLANAKAVGTVRIELVGAAANTEAFLSILQGATLVRPPQKPKQDTPMTKMATATEPITFNLESPYGLK